VRPRRPCPFCGTLQTHLSRHVIGKHKQEKSVSEILSLPKEQQIKQLSSLKKQGIVAHNKKLLADDNPSLLRERRSKTGHGNNNLKICGRCKGVFGRKYIWRHRKVCAGDSARQDMSLPSLKASAMCNSTISIDSNFHQQVVSKLRDDECGLLVRGDRLIMHVGLHYYRTSPKKDRKLVMTHMRRLGCLLLQFRAVCNNCQLHAEDLLSKGNFTKLTEVLDAMCVSDVGEKHNLKLALGYLLKKAAKVLQGLYLIDGDDEKYEEVAKFQKLLEFHFGELFGEALYKADKRRQEKLRKPRELPLESDLRVLRKHCRKVMAQLTGDEYKLLEPKEFAQLRAAVVTRLTVFNARRGSEPARMTIADWETGEHGDWIDPQTVHHIDDEERQLLKRMKLVYMEGKGTKDMIPVIVPEECVGPIRRLISERPNCGIHERNPYLFPYGQNSKDHVVGWHEMRRVCLEANVAQPNLVTANRVRHRAATIHAASEYSDKDKEAFFKHMGHSKDMDAKVYQCPLGLTEVCTVGKYLEELDSGSLQQRKG